MSSNAVKMEERVWL